MHSMCVFSSAQFYQTCTWMGQDPQHFHIPWDPSCGPFMTTPTTPLSPTNLITFHFKNKLYWYKCKIAQPLWKMAKLFLIKLNMQLPYGPEIVSVSVDPRHGKTHVRTSACPWMCTAALSETNTGNSPGVCQGMNSSTSWGPATPCNPPQQSKGTIHQHIKQLA